MDRFLPSNRPLIVAEIGNNHEGNFEAAQDLVRAAADCGVDAVKFQTFKARYFISKKDPERYRRLSSFELSERQFEQLKELARARGVLFASTPLDLPSADFLSTLVDFYKIASGDNNFWALMDALCRTGKPVVISAGLAGLEEIAEAKSRIERRWREERVSARLAVLHCVSSYPVPPAQANLAAIPLLKQELGGVVGYSDHTLGISACLTAIALGAAIVEKHFTLDKNRSTHPDHPLSADPEEMTKLVLKAAQIREMIGSPQKAVQPCEEPVRPVARRSIVAAQDLERGHRLEEDDITWMRPGAGLPPGEESRILGKRLRREVAFGDLITEAEVE